MLNYTILIICEGEVTEPLFFNSISDELIDGKYNNDIRNIVVRIAPEPVLDTQDVINIKIKHKPKRKKRKTKKVKDIDDDKIKILSGKPPLRWVKTAQEELKTGAFDEVWTVFDNDNHPAKREAFEKAEEKINGKQVNIAYSSRSFEYYLLIHFERIYREFSKTDCKLSKDTFIRCGTNKFPNKDCKGTICINGYAQTKKYWGNFDKNNTKKTQSTYHIIKNKIETGFINSAWIRYKSNIIENDIPIYNRNPYISVDILVKKLVDNDKLYKWIEKNKPYVFDDIQIIIENNTINVKNISNKRILFNENIGVIKGSRKKTIHKKELINPQNSISINISNNMSEDYWFKISYKRNVIMFEHKA